MRKNLAIIILALTTAALLLHASRQRRHLQDARGAAELAIQDARPRPVQPAEPARVAPVQKPPEPTTGLAEDERQTYEERIHALEVRLAESEAAAAPVEEPAPTGATTNAPPMAGIAEMMKNPGMKQMIRAQQKATMELTYGSLLDYLQLSEADLETFKELLLDRQMALIEVSLDMMGGSATPEERKAMATRIKELTEEFNGQIEEFLGEQDYAVYTQYESTQQERTQVNLFKQSLGADDRISDEQEHDLILAMHEARTNFQFSTNFDDQENVDPTAFSPDKITKHLEELTRLQEEYVTRAGGILGDAQLEQFKSSQKQMRAMQEMGLKMGAQMFGKQQSTEAD